jgi:branched-subunit amino acid ABC-type transport system permease component
MGFLLAVLVHGLLAGALYALLALAFVVVYKVISGKDFTVIE